MSYWHTASFDAVCHLMHFMQIRGKNGEEKQKKKQRNPRRINDGAKLRAPPRPRHASSVVSRTLFTPATPAACRTRRTIVGQETAKPRQAVSQTTTFISDGWKKKKNNKKNCDSTRNVISIVFYFFFLFSNGKKNWSIGRWCSTKKKKKWKIRVCRARVLVSGGPRDDCRWYRCVLPKRERGRVASVRGTTVGQASVALVGPRVHLARIRGPTFRARRKIAGARNTTTRAYDARRPNRVFADQINIFFFFFSRFFNPKTLSRGGQVRRFFDFSLVVFRLERKTSTASEWHVPPS